MFYLEDAIAYAATHFRGITDKAGMPYIEHCARVAAKIQTIEGKMAAWNHDVLEDADANGVYKSSKDLEDAGFPPFVIQTIDVVTRRKKESYAEFIDRIIASRNPLAIQVKLCDLEDNMDPRRVLYLPQDSFKKQQVYAEARSKLIYANV